MKQQFEARQLAEVRKRMFEDRMLKIEKANESADFADGCRNGDVETARVKILFAIDAFEGVVFTWKERQA